MNMHFCVCVCGGGGGGGGGTSIFFFLVLCGPCGGGEKPFFNKQRDLLSP